MLQSFKLKPSLLALSVTLGNSFSFAYADTVQALQNNQSPPSMEEMWKIIQKQQKTLEAQKVKISQLEGNTQTNTQQIAETEQKVEATAVAVEETVNHSANSKEWFSKTSLGGYGELHYNNLNNKSSTGSDKNELDFHRFVLFAGHEFNENLRFFSELEVEHIIAADGKNGAVELEQAYIEYDINDNFTAKGGIFLMPFGIINETHEPTTFYGVERNPIEKNIIPTTWFEGGGSINGHFSNGISADLGLSSGLYLTQSSNFEIRSGRQKTSQAKADSGALTGRIKYTGIPGAEFSLSGYYQDDYNQGQTSSSDALTMFETHAIYSLNKFTLKALYSQWKLDGTQANAIGADKQQGWYVEPSFRFTPKIGVFARYNSWDNTASSAIDTEYTQVDIGLNYWLDEGVVLKADYQDQTTPNGKNEYDGFNLGIGYQF